MVDPELTYLDFAATSAVRPGEVTAAVTAVLERVGATSGRGGHRLAVAAGRIALHTRQGLARLLGLPGDAGRIVFTLNATHALNTALFGFLRRGDAVVVTPFEHNAVLRPLHILAERRGIEVRNVPGDSSGALDPVAYARAVEGARLVALNAVSNVTGTRLDVAGLARIAHAAGALVLVDGAQAAGHVPFEPAADGADLLGLSGHKGLLGPQGVGALWVRDGVWIEPLLSGGTGGDSLDPAMPAAYPDHLEAGTTNGPGIAGLGAGVDWLLAHGVRALHERLGQLKSALYEGITAIAGVRVISPPAPDGAGIVTFVARDIDPSSLAARLDREHGVLCRPGLHCAPEVHRMLGTHRTGAVRLSLGWSSTEADVARAVRAVDMVVTSRTPTGTLGAARA